ncbi:hypothetical protein CANCADRAFT_30066 [Tortispora caseinolytica NRRL Y-17796]|uniref:Uncharacterized protein n=1 Tax=Tortispora caseinolytica NRRL Y-17796 TaxID=767744 RepID=A0A1E4TJ10_9ASCO|nr:hypothetical protein CANCADRAFT_30066 [Tortispora caseinolytica NRRL Y-17796]
MGFNLGCGRFGWTALIGILPVVGDIINAWLSWKFIMLCEKVNGGLPADVKSKMVANVLVDIGLGLIPLLGTIFSAVYKCNSRNCLILEKHLLRRVAHLQPGVKVPNQAETQKLH